MNQSSSCEAFDQQLVSPSADNRKCMSCMSHETLDEQLISLNGDNRERVGANV